MRLTVINSGSSGNCYLLESSTGEILMVECGVRFQQVLQAVGFKVNKIVGCALTHNHKDHSKAVHEVLSSGIKVAASDGTLNAEGVRVHHNAVSFNSNRNMVCFGEFSIKAFDVNHDAAEPLGFLIRHKELGTMLFLTDTYYCQYTFPGLTNIMIEANYCEQILRDKVAAGVSPKFLRDRVIQSHMSLRTCKELLQANDLSKVNNIVLIHLSDSNSHAGRFEKEVQEMTGKKTYVAIPGLVIENFGSVPF
ncbi:MBL fold metallo-hydrolase [Dyadobacter bucti]|uniref:MBL fold metallo-hydrolase n=1 Tax=Dyadobacter bucti TaxID=2572203 RepID=UPI0011080341|nr:MBL fold metallo-hydrolase [Dyadobacter bucti]